MTDFWKSFVFTCNDCESPHFNVRWNQESCFWEIVCEGCGDLYSLIPEGYAQLERRGTPDPSLPDSA